MPALSLVPQPQRGQTAVAQTSRRPHLTGGHSQGLLFSEVAILDADWKFWQNLTHPEGERRLHSMVTDRHELRDELVAYPEDAERLAAIAASEMARVAADGPVLEEVEDQQLREQLEALGYIDG